MITTLETLDFGNRMWEAGYERAVDKAFEWLKENIDNVETEDNGISGFLLDEFIEQFRKAMKE